MKQSKFFTLAITALFSMATLSSCSSNDNSEKDSNGETETPDYTLTGSITSDKVLEKDQTYILSGDYTVKSGATLKIPAGVRIVARNDAAIDYIMVEKGGKIEAIGTETDPIIMTAEVQEPGAWGGLHICGDAQINITGGTATSEIGDSPYGGSNDADNSGILKYVIIKYAGQKLDEEHEANGFSFYGVGNGTTVDYVAAISGNDDGYEFFGGDVNLRHALSINNSDDSFDWTEGWRGKAQFLVAYQEDPETLNYDCDRLMECDNYSKGITNIPVAHPIIANVTFVGNNSAAKSSGITFRAGTQISLYNAIVTGKENIINVETEPTRTALKDGTSILNHIFAKGNFVEKIEAGKPAIYTEALFLATENNNTLTAALALSDNGSGKFVGTEAGGNDLSADSFFTSTDYSGAVKSTEDWTSFIK